MKGKEIAGGYIFICNNCEKEIEGKSMHWKKENFTLCFDCIRELAINHIFKEGDLKALSHNIKKEVKNGKSRTGYK